MKRMFLCMATMMLWSTSYCATEPNNGVRPYVKKYEPEVRRVALKVMGDLTDTRPGLFQSVEECFEKAYEEEVLPSLKEDMARVYLRDGKCAGFVTYSMGKPWLRRLLDLEPMGGISYMAVDPDSQKEGVGKSLIHDVLAQMRAAGVDRVELVTQNDSAYKYYAQFGFKVSSHKGKFCARHVKQFKPSPMQRALQVAKVKAAVVARNTLRFLRIFR